MFNVKIASTGESKGQFKTEAEAQAFVKSKKKAKSYFTIVNVTPATPKVKVVKVPTVKTITARTPKTPKVVTPKVKDSIDFTGAVKVTVENRKSFYDKTGWIQVQSPSGKVLHIGKTTNMGKVYSNYVNCSRYKQSYNFNLGGGDSLYFKEMAI